MWDKYNAAIKLSLSDNAGATCPHWMASAPVLVSSLESPSGLKTIYGCKRKAKRKTEL